MTSTLRPCSCRLFEAGNRIEIAGGDVDFVDVRKTGCTASTTRRFAQGHDAKLVSFLVLAELDGMEIALREQGSSWGRAEDALRAIISDALADKAANMVKAGQAKAIRRAVLAAAKPARKSKKAMVSEGWPTVEPITVVEPEPPVVESVVEPVQRQAKIKIGRWTYDATIFPNGTAAYMTKLGGLKNAAAGAFSEV